MPVSSSSRGVTVVAKTQDSSSVGKQIQLVSLAKRLRVHRPSRRDGNPSRRPGSCGQRCVAGFRNSRSNVI